ncbi:MAG TPA: hypothetical protein VGM87_02785 [Roseomonas sp.]|jgi:hypothetical protein
MTPPEKSFVFAPRFNSPPDEANLGGHDATGAFHPGMERYERLYEGLGKQVVTFRFDNSRGQPAARRRQSIIDAMQRNAGSQRYDAIVYFGHGSPRGLLSASFGEGALDALSAAILQHCQPSVKVILYACCCAAPGGFAFKLAKQLGRWSHKGMAVLGHPTRGHSFRNPLVRRYPSDRGETGQTVCPDGMFADWQHAMRGHAEFWALMPFMTTEELAAAL